ncbi:MAG: hypothetical protein ABR548_15500 [Actinomycetota bacterium]|nr:hypothetical protein [Actinomycetota bacterium]
MAEHDVKFRIPWRDLGNSDVVFSVRLDGELLGQLKISKGAVVWAPGKKKKAFRMTWERFDAAMRKGTRGEF